MSKYELNNKNRFNIHTIKLDNNYTEKGFDLFLKQSISRVPNYFHKLGLVVDLLNIRDLENFKECVLSIVDVLKKNEFIIAGFSNNKDSQKYWLNETFNISIFHETTPSSTSNKIDENINEHINKDIEKKPDNTENNKEEDLTDIKNENNQFEELGFEKYIGIVRGGQRIYAKGKNLLIIGDVKANGEVIADGDIIVLGTLNGKAIAGANNNISAIITANVFIPSMISIAGYYRQFDEDSEAYGDNKKLLIKDERLIIEKY